MKDHLRIAECLKLNMRTHRKRLGLTQAELAIRVKRSLPGIQGVESGKHWPEIGTVRQIANALGIEESALFREPDKTWNEALTEIDRLVCTFFKDDDKKIGAWWFTPNPMLGGIKAMDMVRMGRTDKLLRIVKDLIEGNLP